MNDYKYEISDRVHLNSVAYQSLPERSKVQLPNTFKTTIFTVAHRKREGDINMYFIPGYDWQGGSGWVTEAWLSLWCGDGPLHIKVTIDPENDTASEVAATTQELRKQIEDAFGLHVLEIKCTKKPASELDSTG